jgi:ATP-dependent DNA helicase RecG
VGSGVMKIVNSCKAAGLPIPTLEEDVGGFMVKLFKDRFSKEQLEKFGLNDRQMKAVKYVKTKGKITNAEYQEINGIGKSVTIDELRDLVERQIFIRIGETGRGTYYELSNKNDRAM